MRWNASKRVNSDNPMLEWNYPSRWQLSEISGRVNARGESGASEESVAQMGCEREAHSDTIIARSATARE